MVYWSMRKNEVPVKTVDMRFYWKRAYGMFRKINGIVPRPTRCAVNLTALEGTTYAQGRTINRALRLTGRPFGATLSQ